MQLTRSAMLDACSSYCVSEWSESRLRPFWHVSGQSWENAGQISQTGLTRINERTNCSQTSQDQGSSQPRRSGGAPAFGGWARGWVRTKMSPLPPRESGDYLYILIQNPAFWCILWLRKWSLSVFLSRPLRKRIGGNEDCWERAENRGRRPTAW